MTTRAKVICLSLLLLVPVGCGYRSSLDRKVISGTITIDGENVPRGFVRFVPIEGTQGPATSAFIRDGEYRAANRGGVPFGKHRVEITAQRPTGEMIDLGGGQFEEKLEQIGDKKYAGKDSPLTVEVTADGDSRFDFIIPKDVKSF